MTNNEIVDYVYRHYKIGSLIRKIISTSDLDDSYKDLEQYIYVLLLEMENNKLNELYNKKKLRHWVSQVILNQRNYNSAYPSKNNGVYNKYFKLSAIDKIVDIIDEDTHDFRIDFIYYELERIPFGTTGLTNDELRKMLSYELFRFYIERGVSMTAVAKKFGFCRTTARTLIMEAKNNIIKSFKGEYNEWLKNNELIL